MSDFFAILKTHIDSHPPDFGDGDSVLTMLYEAFAEANPMDDGRLKQDFNDLYELMNGMPLRERSLKSCFSFPSSMGLASAKAS